MMVMTSASSASHPSSASRGGRKSASLPVETVEYLKSWMMSPDHVAHPYPTEQEKAMIMAETGIELKQLTNWFVNNRKRYWKPRVEAGTTSTSAAGAVGSSSSSSSTSSTSTLLHPAFGTNNDHEQSANESLTLSSSDGTSTRRDSNNAINDRAVALAAAAAQYQDHLDGMAMRNRRQGTTSDDQPHTISEAGSGASACDDSDRDDDDSYRSRSSSMSAAYFSDPSSSSSSSSSSNATSVMMAEGYRRHEEVDVYVLRPEEDHHSSSSTSKYGAGGGALPTIRDLTIKSSVPKERILATFKCPISYTIPYDIENDKRRVQSRRDGEVLRAKKHYLKLYLASVGVHGPTTGGEVDDLAGIADRDDAPPVTPSNDDAIASWDSAAFASSSSTSTTAHRAHEVTHPPQCCPEGTYADPIVRSRSLAEISNRDPSIDAGGPRRKRARSDATTATPLRGVDEWRELCRYAGGAYCESLPGLEEAARMFGFSSSSTLFLGWTSSDVKHCAGERERERDVCQEPILPPLAHERQRGKAISTPRYIQERDKRSDGYLKRPLPLPQNNCLRRWPTKFCHPLYILSSNDSLCTVQANIRFRQSAFVTSSNAVTCYLFTSSNNGIDQTASAAPPVV
ncbi:LOW QUALITY PROTEIN: hypothetical protein ACHAXA_000024 [Cyclostephanos tholiformis]|uniref:Homeobox domain-containing protein n=1 Tax=Cyclostephanos tholiformis TaxID=382380 RepID=A0ABD3SRG0_9STRA